MINYFDRVVLMANQVDRLGGVGRFVERMAAEFHARGFQVEVLGVNLAPLSERVIVDRPAAIHVDSLWGAEAPEDWSITRWQHKLNPARRRRNDSRRELRLKGVERLRRLIEEWGPHTLVICTQVFVMEHFLDAGYDATNVDHPRIIGQYHGSHDMCVSTGDLKRVVRSYSEVDKFVCLTANDAQNFRRSGLNNVTWIPNPVAKPVSEVASRENVFVALGRYDEQKSLDYIIRAWANVAARLPAWSVELYGEGPLEGYLRSLINTLDVPRIRLMGKTDSVADVLYKSKIHLLSSQYEGLPIAIVEAALAGVPSISFDCAPGIVDLILDGETGSVVPRNNTELFSKAMLELAESPEHLQHFSESGVIHSAQYLPNRIMERWLALIDDINE